jgi:hypothetical protein
MIVTVFNNQERNRAASIAAVHPEAAAVIA